MALAECRPDNKDVAMTRTNASPSATTQKSSRPEDERLPLGSTVAYGLQHVLTMYGGIIAPPLIIGPAAGLDPAEIGALITAGGTRILEVAVMADTDLITPCGGCRQRLSEFATADVPVHLCAPDGIRRTVALGDLLPLSFNLAESR